MREVAGLDGAWSRGTRAQPQDSGAESSRAASPTSAPAVKAGRPQTCSRARFFQLVPEDQAYFIAKEILATERTYLKDLEVLTVVGATSLSLPSLTS